VLENYPWKKFILESLHAGEIPLWNPYQFAGVPFLAAGQSSALYPFSIIYYLLPLPRAYGVFTVVQFFLAGLFTYIFLRALGVERPLWWTGLRVQPVHGRQRGFPMIIAGRLAATDAHRD
jgi:hypothetical protein